MEILSAIVSGVVTKVGEYAVAPVGRQVGYVIQYKSNLQNLRTQVDDLKERRQRTIDVNTITQQVDELTREVDTFLVDDGHSKTKCFHGFCPNPILYYQLSKKATKLMHKIKLHEETEFPPQEICSVPSQDYLAFESRISVVKEIMDELSNPNTNKIGVYGVGGLGKTTLAKEVYRQANAKKLFDSVVIVVDVKNYPERIQKENFIERIQKEIAEKLNINIRECLTEKGRARLLCDKLRDKKILVILDDVWEKIELEDVGIPPTCNILFTSRNREVLYCQMGTQKDFSLDVLDEEESWRLFEKMAGAVVKDKRIREKAIQVSNKCGGLPILIVAVASALRNSTLHQWKDALRRLKKLDMKESEEKALLTLEWSYNQLDAEELKPLFLLCGINAWLYNGIDLYYCFKCSMGLGLLKNVETLEDAQAAFHSLIKKLQNYCLLLEQQDGNGIFKMHDLVRNVAIRIARRDQHVLAYHDEELKEWPNKEFLKKCTMIVVDQSNIPELPEVPWECRELTFLVFDCRNDSVSIPCNFFADMKKLSVLDLSALPIPSLPPSLRFLTNLRTLCLDRCVLEDITLVGQLRNLEILSIWMSKITQLPKEIGQLARLRMLDLTGCSELVLISPNVLASLKSLEDLRMGGNSFRQWEAEGIRNASLLELKQLSKLTALDIHILDANILPPDLFSELERFHIFIGEEWEWLPFDDSFNTLKLKLDRSSHLDRGLEMLLKRSEHLCLDVKEGFDNIFHLLSRSDGIQPLKRLEVQNNAEITHVYNSNAFQNLQSLTLWNLPKLVSFSSESGTAIVTTRTDKQLKSDGKSKQIILENEIGSSAQLLKSGEILMHNLTTLIVHQCDGLRFLLSSSMARSLVQLKHLEIRSCQLMEEIVLTKESGEENTENIFCKLNHLQLQHLPKLTRFFSGNFIKFPSLEILHLEDCTELGTFISDPPMMNNNTTTCKDNSKSDLKDNLESTGQYFLFDEKVAFPSLERLIIYDLPKLMTIWHNQLAQSSFCRLKKLDIQRCHDLTKIFAASIMGRLNALDTLQIENCKSLQVLFELDGINAEKTDESSGTQLRIVECCQNLDLVKIISCERLKNIFPASVVKSLHNLRMLHVELCDGVEAIVGKKEGPQTIIPKFMFQKVTDVSFRNMPQLTSFYTGMHSTKWPLLKKIEMFGCHKVEIFASEFVRFQDKIASAPGSRQPFFLIEKGSLLNLETLYLGDTELEIWDGPLPEELSTAWSCKLKNYQLASKSSAAFLEKLRNLENLYVFYVPFKEIFVNEANSSVGSLQLLHLKELQLYEMTELVHLGKDNSQPVIPNLEILEVKDCVRLRNVTSPAIAFQNLTTLKVIGCHGLEFLTTCSIAQSLMQLKHMEVKDCRGMIQILENSNQDSVSIEIAFLRLQHLELSGLPSLQRFCSGNCVVKLSSLDTLTVDNADITYVINHNAFQKLQSLTLMNLPKPISFSTRTDKQLKIDGESREIMLNNEIATPVQLFKNGEIVMPNLTSLIVHQFNGLRFLLSSSMARSLVQLKHLEIRSCQIMEEIVSTKESGEENTKNLFCKLTHLELQHLPKLTRFCSGNLIKFLSLEILHLEDCTELRTFITDPSMIRDNITTCKDNSESDLKDNLEPARQYFLFDEKVAFPSLERLTIYDLPKLMTIWHNQLAQSSFCRLKKLDIQRCHYLINIFAASIMVRLNALDTLHIEDCKSLQVLFELDGINAEKIDESSGTQLRIVECCQNLNLVKIISCERLKNIFPTSVVKSLHNLRMLHVELCNGVETIVGKEEGPQTTIPKFMFPKVIYVEFKNLPQLMSFYPGMHSSKWPLLKKLVMNECHKVGIVASEFLRFQEKLASTPGSKQPFFLIEKGSLLNLETLLLGDAELEIWDGPLPEELSDTWPCKLKKFWCNSKSSAAFLVKLRNLEDLSMGYTPFKEIFVNEAYSSSVGSPQLLHLTFLELYKMPELVHLGKDNSQPVIPNLEILEVVDCVRLRNLTSPAIAFQNLTSLKVNGCHGLEFLTTCSIAQSLMQLKHMEVKDCRGLIQILKNSNQDSGSIEIAFLRLQHLELSGLPSLQGFCSGNCIVKLPSLDTLTVSDCLIELEVSPEKLLLSNSRPERIKLIEEEEKDHDKPEGSGKT